MERVLGIIEGEKPGPLIICIAAVHGNEQVGIHAFRNIYTSILNHNIKIRGKLVGILGNIQAIKAGKRFINYDLNRAWTDENVKRILDGPCQHAEDYELIEIFREISIASRGDYTMKVIADLHSTSADRGNFVVVPEDEADHEIIRALKIPVVVDLDQHLKGTLLSYYHKQNYISFAFEGGKIGTESVYQLHTSGLWEILDKSGCISRHDHESEDHYVRNLEAISSGLPRKVKVIHREPVTYGDGFRMQPGFHNFQPVSEGQMIAQNAYGTIHAPADGMIFMPLYQPEGEDGFFIVKEFNGSG